MEKIKNNINIIVRKLITITIAITQGERSKTGYYYTMRATITDIQLQSQYHSASVARRARPHIDPVCHDVQQIGF